MVDDTVVVYITKKVGNVKAVRNLSSQGALHLKVARHLLLHLLLGNLDRLGVGALLIYQI